MSCKSTPDIFSLEMNDFPYCSAACTTASDPITVVISASATIIYRSNKSISTFFIAMNISHISSFLVVSKQILITCDIIRSSKKWISS